MITDFQLQLLGDDPQTTSTALAALAQPQNLDTALALHLEILILSQLHPDANIQSHALQLYRHQHGDQFTQAQTQAFEIFRSIESLFPWESDQHIHTQIANYQLLTQQDPQLFSRLARFSTYREIYRRLGQQLYLLFQLAEPAAQIFQNIINYYPQDPEAYYALARIRHQQHQEPTAIALYEHCLQLDPNHFYALSSLAPLIAQNPDKTEYALALFQRAINVEPFSSELYAQMAQVCYDHQLTDRAHQIIEVALSINPHQPQALNLLGQYYLDIQKDVPKALETYQKGLDHPLHGDNPLLLSSMAALHAESLQDYQKARIYYEKSLAANPLQPQTTLKFAQLLHDILHDTHQAITTLLNYQNLDPNHPDINARLLQLQPPPPIVRPVQNPNLTQNNPDNDNPNHQEEDDDDDWEAGGSDSDE